MYSDYNDSSNKNRFSFLPSVKVLGIIVIIELFVFIAVIYFKNTNKNNGLVTVAFDNNTEYVLANDSKKLGFKINGKTYNGDYSDIDIKLDNSLLASVNNGVITTGNMLGSTNMMVTYNEKHTALGKIIVYIGDRNIVAKGISVPDEQLVLKLSSTFDLFKSISVTPENGYIEKMEYSNSNNSVIKINEKGQIEALSFGESEITIIANDNLRKSFKVIVTNSDENQGFVPEGQTIDKEVEEISFNQKEITINNNIATLQLNKNDIYELKPVITPNDATNKALTFEVIDKRVISITPSVDNSSVTITALKDGTTTVTARSSNGKIGVLTVEVATVSDRITEEEEQTTKKATLYCKSNLVYTGSSMAIATCSNCTIVSNEYAKGSEKSEKTYTVTAKANNGYLFANGNDTYSISCTVKPKASDEKTTSTKENKVSLACTDAYVGSSGTCTFNTEDKSVILISAYTLGDAKSLCTVTSISNGVVKFKCLKPGKVTIYGVPNPSRTFAYGYLECLEKK